MGAPPAAGIVGGTRLVWVINKWLGAGKGPPPNDIAGLVGLLCQFHKDFLALDYAKQSGETRDLIFRMQAVQFIWVTPSGLTRRQLSLPSQETEHTHLSQMALWADGDGIHLCSSPTPSMLAPATLQMRRELAPAEWEGAQLI